MLNLDGHMNNILSNNALGHKIYLKLKNGFLQIQLSVRYIIQPVAKSSIFTQICLGT